MKPARREAYFSCLKSTVEHSINSIELLYKPVFLLSGRYTNKANVALTGTLKLGYKFRTNFNADNEDYLFSYYLTGNINTPTNADYVFMLTLLNDGGSDRDRKSVV